MDTTDENTKWTPLVSAKIIISKKVDDSSLETENENNDKQEVIR